MAGMRACCIVMGLVRHRPVRAPEEKESLNVTEAIGQGIPKGYTECKLEPTYTKYL